MGWIIMTIIIGGLLLTSWVLLRREWPGLGDWPPPNEYGRKSTARLPGKVPSWVRNLILGTLTAVFLLVQGFAVTTRVDEGNVGVQYEFGAITGTLPGTGLQFHVPWANIRQVNVKDDIATFGSLFEVQPDGTRERVRQGDYPGFTAASSETQAVGVAASLNFRVQADRADDLLAQFGTDWFRIIIENRMQTYIKAETTKFETAALPTNRAAVQAAVEESLRNDEAIVRSGIVIVKVTIDDFDLDDQFLQAIRDKQVEEQRAERAKEEQKRLVTEAETQQQQTVIAANAQAEKVVIDANADAERVQIAADAEATRRVTIARAEADAVRLAGEAEADRNRAIAASLTDDLITAQAIANLANVNWGLLPADSDFLLDPSGIRAAVGG